MRVLGRPPSYGNSEDDDNADSKEHDDKNSEDDGDGDGQDVVGGDMWDGVVVDSEKEANRNLEVDVTADLESKWLDVAKYRCNPIAAVFPFC